VPFAMPRTSAKPAGAPASGEGQAPREGPGNNSVVDQSSSLSRGRPV
jgi:hypothetical protein